MKIGIYSFSLKKKKKKTAGRSCIPGPVLPCDNSQDHLLSVGQVLVSSVPQWPRLPIKLHKDGLIFLSYLATVSFKILNPCLADDQYNIKHGEVYQTRRWGNCSISVNYFDRKSCLELAIDEHCHAIKVFLKGAKLNHTSFSAPAEPLPAGRYLSWWIQLGKRWSTPIS